MKLQITILSHDQKSEGKFRDLIESALSATDFEYTVDEASRINELGQIVLIDGTGLDGADSLARHLETVGNRGGRGGRVLVWMIEEGRAFPKECSDGTVDDVLVTPFRPAEVASLILRFQKILAWDEVENLNASFGELLERLHEDLSIAESLQKSRLPVRFPEVRGMKIKSRYLAGLRSGGDYFDLAESSTGSQISLLMSDSSSYGLSSSVIAVLMKVALRLSAEDARSCRDTVRKIHSEILAALRPTDQLSLFYGAISRRDLKFRYINLGHACVFYSPSGKDEFRELPVQAGPITRQSGIAMAEESELILAGGDRLAILSDGFIDAAGGADAACALLGERRKQESLDSINELVFRVKSQRVDVEELPPQDCSAVLIDLDPRWLKLS